MKLAEHFTSEEFACHHCGANGIRIDLVDALEKLRMEIWQAITINSGYRCPNHPEEIHKAKPGRHSEGIAADLSAPGTSLLALFKAIRQHLEFRGIGVNKAAGYIHVDMRRGPLTFWKYVGHKTVAWDGNWETL
jgi:uncharacterized protein YcbK (DUF882 family)